MSDTYTEDIVSEMPAPILVIGAGNLLMGDEGVGVHALRELETRASVSGVRLLDGGTGGVNLLGELEGARWVIFIDATRDGQSEGAISYLQPGLITEIPRGLSAHDFGVKDLFAAAMLLGSLPELHVFTISVETLKPMCMELSPRVASAIPEVLDRVGSLIGELRARL